MEGVHVKRSIALAAAVITAAVVVPAVSAHVMTPSRIRHVAVRDVAAFGHATRIRYVLTTRARADRLLNDIVLDRTPSFLIVAEGRFRFETTVPGETVHGAAVAIIVNARTGAETDFGVLHRSPNLAKLGHVITVRRRGRRK